VARKSPKLVNDFRAVRHQDTVPGDFFENDHRRQALLDRQLGDACAFGNTLSTVGRRQSRRGSGSSWSRSWRPSSGFGLRPRRRGTHDQIDLALHRLGGESGKSLAAPLEVKVLDGEVLAFDPAQLTHPTDKLFPRLTTGHRHVRKPRDPVHLSRLLALRAKRRRAQAQSEAQRVSPTDVHLTWSARSSSDSSRSGPSGVMVYTTVISTSNAPAAAPDQATFNDPAARRPVGAALLKSACRGCGEFLVGLRHLTHLEASPRPSLSRRLKATRRNRSRAIAHRRTQRRAKIAQSAQHSELDLERYDDHYRNRECPQGAPTYSQRPSRATGGGA